MDYFLYYKNYLTLYFFVIFFGFVGNFISFCIFSRKFFRIQFLAPTSALRSFLTPFSLVSVFLIFLSALILDFIHSIASSTSSGPKVTSIVESKTGILPHFTCFQAWILAIIGFDRMLSIAYPTKWLFSKENHVPVRRLLNIFLLQLVSVSYDLFVSEQIIAPIL